MSVQRLSAVVCSEVVTTTAGTSVDDASITSDNAVASAVIARVIPSAANHGVAAQSGAV